MRLKLTRLVLITCMALLGIIALQVFWLIKAYKEQRERLMTLSDNALIETQFLTGVNTNLRAAAKSIAGDMWDALKLTGHNHGDTIIPVVKRYDINIRSEYGDSGEEGLKKEIMSLISQDSSAKQHFTLEEYRRKIAASLQLKQVTLPFELALIGPEGTITACTADTASFRKTSLKTAFALTLPVTLNPKQSGRIQLAFPDATFYLLKGMGAILLLSLLFITVCAFSFSYMVALFYRQKKIAEIRNDFMNNMTHELKTPISSVSVALELLRDESVPVSSEVREEYFNIAGNELKRLTLLVDKVLRMAAFEKMQVKVVREWFAAQPWISDVLQSVKPLAEAGKAVIHINVQPEQLQFYADKEHMGSVLQNLLENALKYADPNKPLAEIYVDAYADERFFYIRVTDNGTGIPSQYQQRIFDKFFRVPSGDNHETKGYGLGLSYVLEIVLLHGGSIQVDSEWKKGSVFTVSIPKQG